MARQTNNPRSSLNIPGFPHHGDVIQRMTTKSAMSPMLVLLGISMTTLLPAVYLTSGRIQEILTYLVGLVVISAIGTFVYFTIFDRDRLQSEEYLTEVKRISILGKSGNEPTTLDLIAEQTPNFVVETEEVSKIDGN